MFTAALALAAAVPLAAHLASAALAVSRGRREGASQGAPFRPFISLLRPVKGLDAFDLETLGSSFAQDYPRYEVIFCADRADDPACAPIRTMIAARPGLFAVEIAQGPMLGLVGLATLGAARLWTAAVFLGLWYGAEIAFAKALGLALGARDVAAMALRDHVAAGALGGNLRATRARLAWQRGGRGAGRIGRSGWRWYRHLWPNMGSRRWCPSRCSKARS